MNHFVPLKFPKHKIPNLCFMAPYIVMELYIYIPNKEICTLLRKTIVLRIYGVYFSVTCILMLCVTKYMYFCYNKSLLVILRVVLGYY